MVYEITLFIEITLLIICLYDFYGREIKFGLKELILIASHFLLMESISKGIIPFFLSATSYLLLFSYSLIVFKQRFVKTVVNLCLTILMLSILQMVTLSACILILQDLEYDNSIVVLLIYIMMAIFYCIIRKVISLRRIAEFFQKRDVIINCMFIICVGILAVELIRTKRQGTYYFDYIIVAVLIIMVLILAVNWMKYKEKALQSEAQILAYEAYSKTFEKLIWDIRMKQHDFKDHINAIYSQHHKYDNYEDLVANQRQYCAGLLDDNKYYSLLSLNSAVLAGFLYGKFLELESRGIEVSYDINAKSLDTGIPEYKLVEIFANLINNAVDALETKECKRLNVSIKDTSDKYIISVSNVGDVIEPEQLKQMFGRSYSSKGKGRGLGLYILKTMSKEYGFFITCENELIQTVNWVKFTVDISKDNKEKN